MQVESNGAVFSCRIDGEGPWMLLSHGLATVERPDTFNDAVRTFLHDVGRP